MSPKHVLFDLISRTPIFTRPNVSISIIIFDHFLQMKRREKKNTCLSMECGTNHPSIHSYGSQYGINYKIRSVRKEKGSIC